MARALDVCLILHADHGLQQLHLHRPRRSSPRLSDLYSALTAAVGSLRGPLHGGANEEVMVMLNEIPPLALLAQQLEPTIMTGEERKDPRVRAPRLQDV